VYAPHEPFEEPDPARRGNGRSRPTAAWRAETAELAGSGFATRHDAGRQQPPVDLRSSNDHGAFLAGPGRAIPGACRPLSAVRQRSPASAPLPQQPALATVACNPPGSW